MIHIERTTTHHPCSIETAPFRLTSDSGDASFFACGLYELDEGSGKRFGAVSLYNQNGKEISSLELQSGVLDMKWSDHQLAIALSDATLNLVEYQQDDDLSSLVPKTSIREETYGLFLSLDWNNSLNFSNSPRIAVSTQLGGLQTYSVNPSGLQPDVHFPDAHMMDGQVMPTWITAFNPHSQSTIISGGDDMKLKLWDLRLGAAGPTTTVSKEHEAGVTAADWHPSLPNVFATGSYDENIRIWDDRALRRPVITEKASGGLWRLKWRAREGRVGSRLVAACMHGGLQVYNWSYGDESSTNDESKGPETYQGALVPLSSFSNGQEGQLIYGLDTLAEDTEESIKLAACSFYENKLYIVTSSKI
jgi:diphthamide biosynthesis protein 7